jgi:hypothetical protein
MRDAIAITLRGYSRPASEYLQSPLGRALVLDQSVNAPANLPKSLGSAINTLITRNPGLSEDPEQWGVNKARYEQELIEIYGPARSMINATGRYHELANLL